MKNSLVNHDIWILICSGEVRSVFPLPFAAIRFICPFSLIRFKISLLRFSENIFYRRTQTRNNPVYLPRYHYPLNRAFIC